MAWNCCLGLLLPSLALSNPVLRAAESWVKGSPNSPLRMGLLLILLCLPSFTAALPSRVVKTSWPGWDPHSQCFVWPSHDMNMCGPCLPSPPHAQQCRAISCFCRIWNSSRLPSRYNQLTRDHKTRTPVGLNWPRTSLAGQLKFGLCRLQSLVSPGVNWSSSTGSWYSG